MKIYWKHRLGGSDYVPGCEPNNATTIFYEATGQKLGTEAMCYWWDDEDWRVFTPGAGENGSHKHNVIRMHGGGWYVQSEWTAYLRNESPEPIRYPCRKVALIAARMTV